ncbi:MAG: glycine--tRNA ligase subunit beta [Candidatus Dadabacteria bacterium]|nr:MAG: glycine--tRNA ligase subunit beta [Candidatus Dadabacteria bacterium]
MSAADLLLEVGVEEIPARFLPSARRALAEAATQTFAAWQVGHGAIEATGTPRRIVLIVRALETVQADRTETITGPPWDRAFDDQGAPTAAAEGFARKHGIAPQDLQQIDTPRGPAAGLTRTVAGRETRELLAEAIPDWLAGLPFGKNMRWEETGVRFARPVRWLVACLGGEPVSVEFAGIVAGAQSSGHRFYGGPFTVASVDDYLAALPGQFIELRPEDRRERIVRGANELAAGEGVRIDWDDALLDEVVDLVEWPLPLLGRFAPEFLELPDVVLEAPMKGHQRYFPVRNADGSLANRFLIVSNQPEDPEGLIVAGNQRVLSARLSDARFFWDQDLARPIHEHAEALQRITWQTGLGTLQDLVERVARLATDLAPSFEASTDIVREAAALYLADLGTQMVYEFAELQGEIGAIYAERQGVAVDVVEAMRGAHQPRASEDPLPDRPEAAALSVAHRIVQIVGHLLLGHRVRGNQDPYGMRRAAIGVMRVLTAHRLPVSVTTLSRAAADLYAADSVDIPDDLDQRIVEFWEQRLAAWLEQAGADAALSRAAARVCEGLVTRAAAAVTQIQELRHDTARYEALADTYKRLRNIARDTEPVSDIADWTDAETAPFAAVLAQAEQELSAQLDLAARGADADLVAPLMAVIEAADVLFEDVRINADDPAVALSRKGLLRRAQSVFDRIVDFDLLISGGSRS